MERFLLTALLAAAPAYAQVAAPPLYAAAVGDAAASARALAAKRTPAPVDPKPVQILFDRLSQDGERLETRDGVEDAYRRLGAADARGRLENLQVGVVEAGDPDAAMDASGAPQIRDLVMRRAYSSLQAQSEAWTMNPDGTGRIDIWHYSVSLDGWLVSVVHDEIPLKPGPGGAPSPQTSQAHAYRLSPSDPAVQARWKELARKLLTLGRLTAV